MIGERDQEGPEPVEIGAVETLARSNRPRALNALGYTIGTALPQGLTFLLLPVYTRAMPPGEYGALAVVLACTTLATIVLALGLELSIYRSIFELHSQPERQQALIDSVWRFLIVFPLTVGLLVGGALWLTVGDIGYVHGVDMLLCLIVAGLAVAAFTVPLATLRARQRMKGFLLITCVSALTNASLTVVFVVVLHWGIAGWLLGTAAANLMALGIAMRSVPWRRGAAVDRPLVRRSVAFGLPLLPHYASLWALQVADRLILAGLVGPASLGIYSLGSNLSLPVLILVQSLNLAIMPTYARVGTASSNGPNPLASTAALQVGGVTVIAVTGALLGAPLVNLIAPPSYAGADKVIGWIVLGYGFMGLYYVPMNAVTLGAGKTRFVWVATVLSAVTNIGLLFILVPGGGIKAAASASAIGYFVLLASIYVYSRQRQTLLRYPWKRIAATIGSGVALFAVANVTTSDAGAESIVLRLLWLSAWFLVLLFVQGMRVQDVRSLTARWGGT